MDFPKLLNKPSLDLIKNDFPHANKFELEHTSISKQPFLKSGFTFANNTYSIYTNLKNNIYNTKNEIKFDATGISLLDVKYQPTYVRNLNLCGKYTKSNGKGDDTFEVYSEYTSANTNIFSSINVKNLFFKYVHVGSHPKFPQFKFGGLLQGNMDVKNLQYAFGGAYTKNSYDSQYIFSFRSIPTNKHACGSLALNLFFQNKRLNDNAVSIELMQNIVENKSSINVASIWYLNDKNTAVKTKISNDTKVAVSLTHKYNEFVSISLGSQVDITKMSLPDSTKFGVKLFLKS
ncbi:voltage-dependent anion-selective channel protein, putative [Plasmodium knowlesi strain H]|uniref:Voltage-dependent anion-selective channel protein, putative n=3 Tax=Plasmodium knowlesi TaxID=5850 RepID=A0A5E7X6C3_PLAKH|nr:voltage-dependent anion-selective channel protein, putative [Plasmodium knowlesi strain H]OTN67849.1 putative Voltage-dependent anion-selective channel protein [Plasmodium knowlesi]CAA9990303.1 voltage-dependent anion-selective channel protein, putative [Plasmodium knowlesi strain H]SBO19509.1 voltage-dependent anion-selective channel protein, putative [Plasmodium knowlesi strain H]SBO22818.1 voltage-dependent anion-selective channel protein, putative [Plasmodium knowlesi strain H]VVS79777.